MSVYELYQPIKFSDPEFPVKNILRVADELRLYNSVLTESALDHYTHATQSTAS